MNPHYTYVLHCPLIFWNISFLFLRQQEKKDWNECMHFWHFFPPHTQNPLISARQWTSACWVPEVWKFLAPFSLAVKKHTHFFLLPTQRSISPFNQTLASHSFPFWCKLRHSVLHLPGVFQNSWQSALRSDTNDTFLFASSLFWFNKPFQWGKKSHLPRTPGVFPSPSRHRAHIRSYHSEHIPFYTPLLSTCLVSVKLLVWWRIYWTPVVAAFHSSQ